MLVGTWNVNLSTTTTSDIAEDKAAWVRSTGVDLWLFTEVHRDWRPLGRELHVSPPMRPRPGPPKDPEAKRWAGIDSSLPRREPPTTGDSEHSGEEGLVLARLELATANSPTVLVACSVLPWKKPGELWPGLPDGGQATQLGHVLDHHVARIHAARDDDEPLVWGGDFNQQLTPRFEGTTAEGQRRLRAAFDCLGLVALTERAEHLDPTMYAIDHLAVSPALLAGKQVAGVHRPTWNGRTLSNHAAYTAILHL